MSSAPEQLLLYGLFTRLREAGLPLQVRDYLEGLKALQLYGGLEPFQTLSGVSPEEHPSSVSDLSSKSLQYRIRSGAKLVWLCQLLWARSQAERDIVERVITGDIELPPPKLIREAHNRLRLSSDLQNEFQPEPGTVTRVDSPAATEEQKQQEDSVAEAGSSTSSESSPAQVTDTIPVTITSHQDSDLSLPLLEYQAMDDDEGFLLIDEPIISSQWLVSTWRRFFIPVSRSDEVEVDVAATVKTAARSGKILSPVMKVRRKNTARLVVLIDVSEAMLPWRHFESVLVESLDPKMSRLSAVEICYFSSIPWRKAFHERHLSKSEPLAEVLKRNNNIPLLVFGDAGAAKDRDDPTFERRLQQFVSLAQECENRPLIWVNPMPARRWSGSLMDHLEGYPNVYSLELNSEALLRAVDLMRGVIA